METKEIPILLLTGYLGSGKTTLLNYLLSNREGIKFAVIVNDIGEINIDAELIQKGGIVGQKEESLVALQNGCICCTLRTDLIEQIFELMKMQRFDYIVIEWCLRTGTDCPDHLFHSPVGRCLHQVRNLPP